MKIGNESLSKNYFRQNMSNNCIFMATTRITLIKCTEAMKNRPSRFKYVLNIEGIQK
jgi:hypothetical protein